jgi:penicillin-binding protein 1A
MNQIPPRYKTWIYWFWGLFALPFIFVLVLFILISNEKLGPMPGFEELENPENNLAAEVYSEDNVLLGKFYIQNRVWSDYEEISPYVIEALIATEDIRFYQHSGIDIRGLGRVLIKTVLLGQETGGGSTISQQLAKNLFPRDTTTYKWGVARKVHLAISKFKEWQTAVKLEKSYTKDEIITMYLNVIDFLYQAVGIKSAAQVYFSTAPDSLKIEQAAMLVGMVKNPSVYNPLRNDSLMLLRRNVVISQMAKYEFIGREVADSVKQLPIEVEYKAEDHNLGLATYFREYLRTTMIKEEPKRRFFFSDEQYEDAVYEWNNNPLYGWCRKNQKPDGTNYNLYKDGLKIYTTINSKMQQYAEAAVREHLGQDLQETFMDHIRYYRNPPFSDDLDRATINDLLETSMRRTDRYRSLRSRGVSMDSINAAFNTPVEMTVFSWDGEIDTVMSPMDSIRYYKYFARSGLISFDPHTGYVRAYVGGPDFKYFKFDAITVQKRQAGSTIKPFLYTLAMQDGYNPCYKVPNVQYTFQLYDSIWAPASSGKREFWGKEVSLKWGLANSENYVSAWLMKQFNPQSVIEVMRKMGIRSYIAPVVSIFLGTSEFSLYELSGAFGTFSNKGVYTQPIFVSRIENKNGDVISMFHPRFEEALSEENAYLMVNLLQGVIDEGTGNRLRWKYQLPGEIGGKTGTTQNQSDGWFVGITPNLVTGVWTGWEDRSIHFESLYLGGGANMALPIYGLYMQKIFADENFAIMAEDVFETPPNFDIELDCEKYDLEHGHENFNPEEEVIY